MIMKLYHELFNPEILLDETLHTIMTDLCIHTFLFFFSSFSHQWNFAKAT